MPFSFSTPTISDVADIRATVDDFPVSPVTPAPWSRLTLIFVGKDNTNVRLHAYFDGEDRGRAHDIATALTNASATRVSMEAV